MDKSLGLSQTGSNRIWDPLQKCPQIGNETRFLSPQLLQRAKRSVAMADLGKGPHSSGSWRQEVRRALPSPHPPHSSPPPPQVVATARRPPSPPPVAVRAERLQMRITRCAPATEYVPAPMCVAYRPVRSRGAGNRRHGTPTGDEPALRGRLLHWQLNC